MCEIKTVVVFVALLVAALFWESRVHAVKNVEQQSENNIQKFLWKW